MFPFKVPIKSIDELPKFYQDYLLKVSGEKNIKDVPVEDANGFFQLIMDSADATFSYDDAKKKVN